MTCSYCLYTKQYFKMLCIFKSSMYVFIIRAQFCEESMDHAMSLTYLQCNNRIIMYLNIDLQYLSNNLLTIVRNFFVSLKRLRV